MTPQALLLALYFVGNFRLGYVLSVAFVDDAAAPGHRGSASRYHGVLRPRQRRGLTYGAAFNRDVGLYDRRRVSPV